MDTRVEPARKLGTCVSGTSQPDQTPRRQIGRCPRCGLVGRRMNPFSRSANGISAIVHVVRVNHAMGIKIQSRIAAGRAGFFELYRTAVGRDTDVQRSCDCGSGRLPSSPPARDADPRLFYLGARSETDNVDLPRLSRSSPVAPAWRNAAASGTPRIDRLGFPKPTLDRYGPAANRSCEKAAPIGRRAASASPISCGSSSRRQQLFAGTTRSRINNEHPAAKLLNNARDFHWVWLNPTRSCKCPLRHLT
jgi:hypothetical protein